MNHKISREESVNLQIKKWGKVFKNGLSKFFEGLCSTNFVVNKIYDSTVIRLHLY